MLFSTPTELQNGTVASIYHSNGILTGPMGLVVILDIYSFVASTGARSKSAKFENVFGIIKSSLQAFELIVLLDFVW